MNTLRNKVETRPPFNIPVGAKSISVDAERSVHEGSLRLGHERGEKLKYPSVRSSTEAHLGGTNTWAFQMKGAIRGLVLRSGETSASVM